MTKTRIPQALANLVLNGRITGQEGNSLVYPFREVNALVVGLEKEIEELKHNAEKAVGIAENYAHIDGDHHKNWVINKMVRRLISPEEAEANGWNDPDWLEECAAP